MVFTTIALSELSLAASLNLSQSFLPVPLSTYVFDLPALLGAQAARAVWEARLPFWLNMPGLEREAEPFESLVPPEPERVVTSERTVSMQADDMLG